MTDGLNKPLSLMLLPCRANRARGLARYPFLESNVEEFQALWPMERRAPAMVMAATGETGFSTADRVAMAC